MIKRFKEQNGMTMISIVVTIIVMSVLAAVIFNATFSDDGLITESRVSAYAQRYAAYEDELKVSLLSGILESDLGLANTDTVILLDSQVKTVIPSLSDEDIGKFAVINGNLYYLGEDSIEQAACKEIGLITKDDSMTVEEFKEYAEKLAITEKIKNMQNDTFIEIITNLENQDPNLPPIDPDSIVTEEDGTQTRMAGYKLANKVAGGFNTASKWTIVTEKGADGKIAATYASGWYYVPALTEIQGLGKLSRAYLLNYDRQEAVKFNPDIHSIISSGGNLAVTENLIFNADPTNMDGSQSSWGDAKLYGFSAGGGENSVSGWTPTSLNFDGVDDYLEIYVDSTFQSEGITIETYGYFDETNYSKLSFYKGPAGGSAQSFKHTLSNGKPCNKSNTLFQLAGTYFQGIATGSEYQCTRYSNDFHIEIEQQPKYGDVFVTFVLSKQGDFKVYVDGKLSVEDKFNTAYAEKFQTYLKNKNYPIQLGKNYTAATPVYHKQKVYSIRVYDSLLSADDILANYNATTSYHELMVENGGAASNENDHGSSFDQEFGK